MPFPIQMHPTYWLKPGMKIMLGKEWVEVVEIVEEGIIVRRLFPWWKRLWMWLKRVLSWLNSGHTPAKGHYCTVIDHSEEE